MKISLNFSDIRERIYATTAIATLSTGCKIALLHPDHAPALNLIIADSLATIVSAVNKLTPASIDISDDSASVTVPADAADAALARNALLAAACSITLAQVKIAASEEPGRVVKLAAVIQSIADAVAPCLAPVSGTAYIRPYL